MMMKRLTLIAPALQFFLLGLMVGLIFYSPHLFGLFIFLGLVWLGIATVQFAWLDSFELQLIKYCFGALIFLFVAFLLIAMLIGADQGATLFIGSFAILFGISQAFWFWLERGMVKQGGITPYKKARRFYVIQPLQVMLLAFFYGFGFVVNFIGLSTASAYGVIAGLFILSIVMSALSIKGLESIHVIIVKYGIPFVVFFIFGLFDQFVGTLYLIFAGSLLAMFRFEMRHMKGELPWRNRANDTFQKRSAAQRKK